MMQLENKHQILRTDAFAIRSYGVERCKLIRYAWKNQGRKLKPSRRRYPMRLRGMRCTETKISARSSNSADGPPLSYFFSGSPFVPVACSRSNANGFRSNDA